MLLALVGGGFWVLATYGKKVVTAPVESIIQPPWIKEAVAYAPKPAAAAKAAGPTERETVLAEQLTALQEEVKTQRAVLAALKRPTATSTDPDTQGGTHRCGTPDQGVWLHAPYFARPEGNHGRPQGQ